MTSAPAREDLWLASGPNVRLRHRVRADAEDEYRWRSDPETARYDGREPYRDAFERFLDVFGYELAYGRNDREQLAIETNDGRHIGSVMFYNLSAGGDSAEFGISIGDEDDRSKGLGREAAILALRWLWSSRAIRLVYLHALDWNDRAIRSFRKAGFDDAAIVIRDGKSFVKMEVRREWWLLWDMEGRFALSQPHPSAE